LDGGREQEPALGAGFPEVGLGVGSGASGSDEGAGEGAVGALPSTGDESPGEVDEVDVSLGPVGAGGSSFFSWHPTNDTMTTIATARPPPTRRIIASEP